MKISVVIPVFNAEKTIKKCVESCLPLPEETEIVVVDDGSTDSTLTELASFEGIRIVSNDHQGHGRTRMCGIKEAKGDYILFVDSDDYIADGAIELLVNEVKADDPDILAYSYYFWGDKENKYIKYDGIANIKDQKTLFLYGASYFWNKLIKRSFLEKEVIENIYGEDDAVVLPMLLRCNKFKVIDIPLYYHTTLGNGLSEDHAFVAKITESYDRAINRIKSDNLFEEYKTAVFRLIAKRRFLFAEVLKYRFSDDEIAQINLGFDRLYHDHLQEFERIAEYKICFSGMPVYNLHWTFEFFCRLCEIDINNMIHLIEQQEISNIYAIISLDREELPVLLGVKNEEDVIREFINNFNYLVKLLNEKQGKGIAFAITDKRNSFQNKLLNKIQGYYDSCFSVINPDDPDDFMDLYLGNALKHAVLPKPKLESCERKKFIFKDFSMMYVNRLLCLWNDNTDYFLNRIKAKNCHRIALYGCNDITRMAINELRKCEEIEISAIYDRAKGGIIMEGIEVKSPDFSVINWEYIIVIPFYIYDSIFFQLVFQGVPYEKICSIEEFVVKKYR